MENPGYSEQDSNISAKEADQQVGGNMARGIHSDAMTTIDKSLKHDDLMPLLAAMFREFQDASKKKPDGVLNKRKVEIVNRLLQDVFTVVEGESTRVYLDLLDEDELPQNSDVVLILGQALAAMEGFKEKYHRYIDHLHDHGWATSQTLANKRR
jgi:hypothetical protein